VCGSKATEEATTKSHGNNQRERQPQQRHNPVEGLPFCLLVEWCWPGSRSGEGPRRRRRSDQSPGTSRGTSVGGPMLPQQGGVWCGGLWITVVYQYYRVVADILSIPDGLIYDRPQTPCVPLDRPRRSDRILPSDTGPASSPRGPSACQESPSRHTTRLEWSGRRS
jgi:hypothetical protein